MGTSTSRKNRWRRSDATIALALLLVLLGCAGYAAAQPRPTENSLDEPIEFDIPRLPAVDVASIFAGATGVNVQLDSCHDVPIGPLRGLYTPRKAWTELFSPLCLDLDIVDDEGITPALIARERGLQQYDFKIPKQSRAKAFNTVSKQAGGLLLGYLSLPDEADDRELVGPFRGRMSVQKILELVVGSADLAIRWAEDDGVSIEPRQEALKKTSRCACTQNLIIVPPPSEHVTVKESRLPQLGEYISAPILVMDRKRIDETGAATMGELLNYFPQMPFSFSEGSTSTGAQYAQLRGLEPENTVVLINGRRTFPSAIAIGTNAFDLNTVPLAAVERIEVSDGAISVGHGADGLGGTMNIVLKSEVDHPTIDVRYGGAKDGAHLRRASVSFGNNGPRAHSAIVIDYLEKGELLGRERERSRDQDYRRFGSTDLRSRFAAPANISSLDGQALPGLDDPIAAIRWNPDTQQLEVQSGETNLESLTAYDSIVPRRTQASISSVGEWKLGEQRLSSEALYVRRNSTFNHAPGFAAGVWGADHPQNPFGTPVFVETLLTGQPASYQSSKSELLRLVAALRGRLNQWDYEVSAVTSKENSNAWWRSSSDPESIGQALSATGESALNLFTLTPGAGNSTADLLGDVETSRYTSVGKQIVASAHGTAATLPGGEIKTSLGMEWREESANFDSAVGERGRDIAAAFTQLRIPLVGASMEIPAVTSLELAWGMRVDDYSDIGASVHHQYSLTWQPHELVRVYATRDNRLLPPSMFNLFFPQLPFSFAVYDPRRDEVAPVTLLTGGNQDLKPTRGSFSSVGILFSRAGWWSVSVDRWQLRLKDRAWSLPYTELLANEEATDRIEREPPSASDIERGLPGHLSFIDIRRMNLGEIATNGYDLSAQTTFRTGLGRVTPRLDITWTDEFAETWPFASSRPTNRVGRTDFLGTIPAVKGIASLTYAAEHWGATVYARYHSEYKDWSWQTNSVTKRRIPRHILWDASVTRSFAEQAAEIKIGVADAQGDAPPFSEVSMRGFDSSQRDLTGRYLYVQITGSF